MSFNNMESDPVVKVLAGNIQDLCCMCHLAPGFFQRFYYYLLFNRGEFLFQRFMFTQVAGKSGIIEELWE